MHPWPHRTPQPGLQGALTPPWLSGVLKCSLPLCLNFSAPLHAFRGKQCRCVPSAGPLETGQGLVSLVSVNLGPDARGMSKGVGESEGPWPEPSSEASYSTLVTSWRWGAGAGSSQPVCISHCFVFVSVSLLLSPVDSSSLYASASPYFCLSLCIFLSICLCPDSVYLSLNLCLSISV